GRHRADGRADGARRRWRRDPARPSPPEIEDHHGHLPHGPRGPEGHVESTTMIGLAIEALVAVLLITTIGYCWVLNNRLQRLRADEKALKATIFELVGATEVADRAINGLKEMVYECDKSLSMRLVAADRTSNELAAQVRAGET